MVSGENTLRRGKYSSLQRFYRLLRLRLIIPMFRARQPAENTARAVAVGLFWAFTPTFGIQMGLTFIHWYCSRTFLKKDFNVVVAMAWPWVTNVFTVPICYYLFFLTGQILLGRWSDLTGYESFNKFWATAMGAAGSDAALETADVALMADDVGKLPYLFRLSRRSRRVIRQNVSLSIVVKLALVAGVVPGAVSLIVAVLLGDVGTSLLVTGNATRLAAAGRD